MFAVSLSSVRPTSAVPRTCQPLIEHLLFVLSISKARYFDNINNCYNLKNYQVAVNEVERLIQFGLPHRKTFDATEQNSVCLCLPYLCSSGHCFFSCQDVFAFALCKKMIFLRDRFASKTVTSRQRERSERASSRKKSLSSSVNAVKELVLVPRLLCHSSRIYSNRTGCETRNNRARENISNTKRRISF